MEDFDTEYQRLWKELDQNVIDRIEATKSKDSDKSALLRSQRDEIVQRMSEHCQRATQAYHDYGDTVREEMFSKRYKSHSKGRTDECWF